jgi:hypothetical protein
VVTNYWRFHIVHAQPYDIHCKCSPPLEAPWAGIDNTVTNAYTVIIPFIVTSTGAIIKHPDTLRNISTFVNKSYNFTGHLPLPTATQPATPSPPLPDMHRLRLMSASAQGQSKQYENGAIVRAHRLNTASGQSTPQQRWSTTTRNSTSVDEHRANSVSTFSPSQGQHRKHAIMLRGNETPSTPSPQQESATHSTILEDVNGYSILNPIHDFSDSDTCSTECHPYLDYQPRLENSDRHFSDAKKDQEECRHYDMDSQLSDSTNHTYEPISEVPEANS